MSRVKKNLPASVTAAALKSEPEMPHLRKDDDLLVRVDAHRLFRRREWPSEADSGPSVNHALQDLDGLSWSVHSNGQSSTVVARNVKSLSRSARIKVLEGLVDAWEKSHDETLRGVSLTSARARRERRARGERPFGQSFRESVPAHCVEVPFGDAHKSHTRRAFDSEEAEVSNHWVEDGLSTNDTHGCISALASAVQDIRQSEDPERITKLSTSLEVRAYDLRMNDAIRALIMISVAASQMTEQGRSAAGAHTKDTYKRALAAERAGEELRASARRLTACIASRCHDASARLVADAMAAMAVARNGEQEYLDAMLARLSLLLRRDPRSLTPHVLGTVVGALGRLHDDRGDRGAEVSAHSGVSTGSRDANARFLLLFGERLVQALPYFLEEDFGLFHEAYFSTYATENEAREVVVRAARLQVGLSAHLDPWVRIERAVRLKWPNMVSTLQGFQEATVSSWQALLLALAASNCTPLESPSRRSTRHRQKSTGLDLSPLRW